MKALVSSLPEENYASLRYLVTFLAQVHRRTRPSPRGVPEGLFKKASSRALAIYPAHIWVDTAHLIIIILIIIP